MASCFDFVSLGLEGEEVMKRIDGLCYAIVVLTLISALVGIFYSTGGSQFTVENIYGDTIELFGDGIYKHNSVLKASGNKGTDLVMLIVALVFAFLTRKRHEGARYGLIHAGLLTGLLYYSSSLVFGITFNSLFLVYTLQFSLALFAMIFVLAELFSKDRSRVLADKSMKGTAIFLIVSGSSVLVWLEFIIPSLLSGQPLANIEIYTTEPTFVLDLAIIFPLYLGCGIALLKRKPVGYKLAPILLTFITIIGLTVIGQNAFQSAMGVSIPIRQLFGLVISFIVLGFIATLLNVRLLKYVE